MFTHQQQDFLFLFLFFNYNSFKPIKFLVKNNVHSQAAGFSAFFLSLFFFAFFQIF
jgi:hypothetical protein